MYSLLHGLLMQIVHSKNVCALENVTVEDTTLENANTASCPVKNKCTINETQIIGHRYLTLHTQPLHQQCTF